MTRSLFRKLSVGLVLASLSLHPAVQAQDEPAATAHDHDHAHDGDHDHGDALPAATPAAAQATMVATRLAFLPDVLATFDPEQSLTRDEFLALVGRQLGMVLQADMTDDKIRVALKPAVEEIINSRMLAVCAKEAGINPDLVAARSTVQQAVVMRGPEVLEGQDQEAVVAMVAERQQIIAWIDKEIASTITIEPADVDAFYELHREEIVQSPAQVRASHILISVAEGADEATHAAARTKIEAVLKEAKAGKDFAELARTHSTGPSGPQGGDLGLFSHDRMVKPFADAAFALEVGGISDVVKTQFGYHIILCTEKKPPVYLPLDDRVRGLITEHMRETKTNEAVEARLLTETKARHLKIAL